MIPSRRNHLLARLHDAFAVLCWLGVITVIVGCMRIEFARPSGTGLPDAPEPFVAVMVMFLIAFALTFRLGAKGWRGTTQHPYLARWAPLWVLVFLGWVGMIWYDAVGYRLLHRYIGVPSSGRVLLLDPTPVAGIALDRERVSHKGIHFHG